MFFKSIYLLLNTVAISTSDFVSIGRDYYYHCPRDYAYDSYNYEISLTINNLVMHLQANSKQVRLKLNIHKLDNNTLYSCTTFDYQYYQVQKITTTLKIKRNKLKTTSNKNSFITNALLEETSEMHYYRESETYYFECLHNKFIRLYWIKIDGNDTVQAGNYSVAWHFIEAFNLTAADNDTKLHCFYFECSDTKSEMLCKRVILRSVTLQLKTEDMTNTEISNIYLLIAFGPFGISLMIILILLVIIAMLLRKKTQPSDATSPQPTAVQNEAFYENQDFNHLEDLNMQVEYADLALEERNGQLPQGDDTLYTEVTDTRTVANKMKKRRKCCF